MNYYLILTARKPEFDPASVQEHFKFLDRLRAEKRLELSGPFTDQTGGAYILLADDLEQAQAIALSDPLHTTGSSAITVKEWKARL